MAYNEPLATRIRKRFSGLTNVVEKRMMGGLTFMYHDKMCVGIMKDELMCRIDPDLHEAAIQNKGCRTMDFTNRPMIGYILVDESAMSTDEEFDRWIRMALDYNPRAKSSKKKKAGKS